MTSSRDKLVLMKSYRDKIRDALLDECIGMFEEVYSSDLDPAMYGSPPKSMIIHFGISDFEEKTQNWRLQKDSMEAFVYSEGGCKTAPISRKPSQFRKHGMYYDEASADVGYNNDRKASITVIYGPLYARCFEYDVVDDGDSCRLINRTLLWLS